jgi:hypothetical protein
VGLLLSIKDLVHAGSTMNFSPIFVPHLPPA